MCGAHSAAACNGFWFLKNAHARPCVVRFARDDLSLVAAAAASAATAADDMLLVSLTMEIDGWNGPCVLRGVCGAAIAFGYCSRSIGELFGFIVVDGLD